MQNEQNLDNGCLLSPEVLREAMSALPFGCQVIHPDGRILYVNAALARRFNRPVPRIPGQALVDLWPGIEMTPVFSAMEECMRDSRSRTMEAEVNFPDGSRHCCQVSFSRVAEGVCVLFVEIGKGGLSREFEDRFRYFVENASDIVYALSPEGLFTYISPNWLDFIGESAEKALGMSFEPYVHPDDVQLCRDFLEGILTKGNQKGSVEYRVQRRDGTWRWHLSKASPIRDGNNTITGYLGIASDITERKLAEEALRESEQKWRNILIRIPQVGVALNPEARIVFANAYFLELTGWKAEEILGRNWFDLFIPEEEREEVRGIFDKVMHFRDTGPYSTNENEIVTRSGQRHNIAWSNVLTKNIDGDIIDVTCLGVDITERIRAEAALAEAALRMQTAVRAAKVGLWDWNLVTNEVHFSAEWKRQIGYAEDEIADVYETWASRIHPDDKVRTVERNRRVIAKPDENYSVEFRFRHRNGDYIWILAQGTVLCDEAGKPVRFLGVHIDITERKQAEEETLAHERYVSTILRTVADGFLVVDTDGKLVDVNEAYCRMSGYTRDELLSMSVTDLDVNEASADTAARIQYLVSHGSDMFESRHQRKDGSVFPVEVSVTWLEERGGRFVSFCRDLTERKRLQSQLIQAQKMEAVGRLAGGVAHDFNNMLGAILGHAELALSKTEPGDLLRDDLQEIISAASRSADVTRQLLAFASKQIILPKVLDLNRMVEDMLKMLRRLIGEDIDLAWMPGGNLPPVKMDPSQIDQILVNLCVNARDAINGVGKLTIETNTVYFDEAYCAEHVGFVPGDYVLLAVSDNGSGMDRRTLENLFEPFFTTKGLGQGTGLGLATVYGIVRQNRGFINVYSEPGQGTTFHIYLPAHKGVNAQAEPEQAASISWPRGNETILLVEDESAILKITTKMLEMLGYTVLATDMPGKAFDLAGEYSGKIHLLITDVVMPTMNGRELARKLLALYPNVKCLFMSGYTANVIAHHGVLNKDVHFLQKPFSMKDIAVKVRQALAEE